MKLFNTFSKTLLAAGFLAASALVSADVVVVVSAQNANHALDKNDVEQIFLGKKSSFPDGSKAIPIDQNEGSAARADFNKEVLGKTDSQLKAYWSRLIFTGKGTPPKESGGDADVKALVAQNPNLVGYVDDSVVDETVRIVYKF